MGQSMSSSRSLTLAISSESDVGYSLSLPCQSIKARDKFASFLSQNMLPWYSVVQKGKYQYKTHPLYDPTSMIRVGNELSYGASPLKVGFNFTTSGEAGDYMYALLRFGALRVGLKRVMPKLAGTKRAVPYITYDSEAWPVLLKGKGQWVVDPMGCRPISRPSTHWEGHTLTKAFIKWVTKEDKTIDEREQLIAVEMLRLHQLWED